MRALAVLPGLRDRHDVRVFAGDDAYEVLREHGEVTRIPALRFVYNRRRRISPFATARANLPTVWDLWAGSRTARNVADTLRRFRAEVVISDSEPFVLSAARRLGVPRIMFDHFGLLAFCRVEMPVRDRAEALRNNLVYRMLYGIPDRAVVTGFFPATPFRAGVRVVGPVIRSEARRLTPTRGEHLLVYVSIGEQEYTPSLHEALVGLDQPVHVYGAPRSGRDGKVCFKPLANLPFLEDLAGCRAVIATTGNQLIGEVLHFRKPMLGLPIDCLEQRLNARQIERLGIGACVERRYVTTEVIRAFLDQEAHYLRNLRREASWGEHEALAALETYVRELGSAAAQRGLSRIGARHLSPSDDCAARDERISTSADWSAGP